jgi:hypothetical protein
MHRRSFLSALLGAPLAVPAVVSALAAPTPIKAPVTVDVPLEVIEGADDTFYVCVSEGVSADAEPEWIAEPGRVTVDGTAQWSSFQWPIPADFGESHLPRWKPSRYYVLGEIIRTSPIE